MSAVVKQQRSASEAPPVTQMLADFVASHASRGWSDAVEAEAHRTFMNWIGCAIGPSQHDSVATTLGAVMELSPAPQASLLGRAEKVDISNAALINGISSHTFDFDDTHLRTIIHPAGPVAPAALALAEHIGSSGRELIDALVLGIEVSCRVGNAMYPDHYLRGWHITGSTGMLGSAAACSRLLKLDAGRTAMAIGIAASQPIGVREQFGTMTKPFHPGGAAKAGLMAALMARHGFTASPRALEAPRGLMPIVSDKTDYAEITERRGETWEVSLNTYKPFACGIVIHPSIDGCIQLRDAHGLKAEMIRRVVLRVHPLVLELTGKKTPSKGLEGKFSVYHSCAAGIIHGRAGEEEYSDAVVTSADVVALRSRVEAVIDTKVPEDAADVSIETTDGRTLHVYVEHAIGSLARPMTDAQLRAKFVDQSAPVLGAERAARAADIAARIADFPTVKDLIVSCTIGR